MPTPPPFEWSENDKQAAAEWLFKCANNYEFKPLKFDVNEVEFWANGTAHLCAPAHNHTIQYARFEWVNYTGGVWAYCADFE
jgi:hypothetical protein